MEIEADCWTHSEEYHLADDERSFSPDDPRVVTLRALLAKDLRGSIELTTRGWVARVEVRAGDGVHQLVEAANRGHVAISKALRECRMPNAALVRYETHHQQSFPTGDSGAVLLDSPGVCDYLGVSRQRLSQLRHTEWFPSPAIEVGRSVLWRARDIEELAATWIRRSGPKKRDVRPLNR